MRTTRHKTIHKHTLPQKMKRRRKHNKNSNFMFDSKIRDNSAFDLETLNEFLRIHKTARAEGKGSWKLMPKDSCEVYKQRQQRAAKSQSDSCDMETDKPNTRQKKRRAHRQARRKVKKTTGRRSRKKYNKRNKDSSASFSSRTSTNSMSSFTSYSEMDYE